MAFQSEPFLELDQIKVPFLVGAGTEAPDQFFQAHCRLAERAGGELFVGDGADHFAHIGNPEVWAELRAGAPSTSRPGRPRGRMSG